MRQSVGQDFDSVGHGFEAKAKSDSKPNCLWQKTASEGNVWHKTARGHRTAKPAA